MNSKIIFLALLACFIGEQCFAQVSSRGVKRQKEECQQLAMQAATNPRAAGSAVSTSESVAYRMAMVEARAELAAQVASEVTSVIRQRVEQVQTKINGMSSSALIQSDSLSTVQRVSQIIANSRPICSNTYDRDDGSVQVFVCIELNLSAQRQAYQQLKGDGVLSKDVNGDGSNDVSFDEKEFLLELAKAREEYNANNRE
jgi:hypothetical protein